MEDVVIVAAARAATGKFGGALAKVAAPDLGATLIKALLERAGIVAYAFAGLDRTIMGMRRVPASKLCLQRAGGRSTVSTSWRSARSFAAQACTVNKEMGWDAGKINGNGGAIAIGHPIGASGCRVLVTRSHEMIRRNAQRGLASLCIGGGMGVVLTIER
ncbi:MAG: hypothetical protein KUL79_05900 [Thauera sp.]|nr:hypothetical protein [Thauera sp.]